MKSPHDEDNRHFRQAIDEIQESASKMTLDAMKKLLRAAYTNTVFTLAKHGTAQKSQGSKQKKPPGGKKNYRKGKQKAQRQDNHQQGRSEHISRAGADQSALTTYPSTQPTPAYHPSYYPCPIPAWPHPYMMPQMAPWAPGFLPTLGAPRPPEK